jgi:chitinase
MDNKKPETEEMRSTKEQLLINPDIQPSSDVIAKALGESNNAYIKFINELTSHDIHLEWRYYNDGKRGWQKDSINGQAFEAVKMKKPFSGYRSGTVFSR